LNIYKQKYFIRNKKISILLSIIFSSYSYKYKNNNKLNKMQLSQQKMVFNI